MTKPTLSLRKRTRQADDTREDSRSKPVSPLAKRSKASEKAEPTKRSAKNNNLANLPARAMSASAVRAFDQRAIARGVPSLVLMEGAALAIANAIGAMFPELALSRPRSTVLIVAGVGNNGGDGLALARILSARGVNVVAMHLQGKLSADARAQKKMLEGLGIRCAAFRRASELIGQAEQIVAEGTFSGELILIDALLGTSVQSGASRSAKQKHRQVTGVYAECIDAMCALREAGVVDHTVSIDVPSGLDATSGLGASAGLIGAVRADTTLTIGALKTGLLNLRGRGFAGSVRLVASEIAHYGRAMR
jgi:hydroxyethylthiazole kinase-like uncharacterized protein yjeF